MDKTDITIFSYFDYIPIRYLSYTRFEIILPKVSALMRDLSMN